MKNKSDAHNRDRAKKHPGASHPKQATKAGRPTEHKAASFDRPKTDKAAGKASHTGAAPSSQSRNPFPKTGVRADARPKAAPSPADSLRKEQKQARPERPVRGESRPAAKSGFAKPFEAKHAAKPVQEKRSEARPAAAREQARPQTKPAHRPERPQREELKPRLHSGQTVELQITSTNDDGFGVAIHEGTRVLVAGGLPGEVLVTRITYVGRRESFANTLKCLKSSPDREPAPACTLGRKCDGCPLIQMRYPAQLAWKKNMVAREIHSYPSLSEVPVRDTVASPNRLNYRNTAKLVIAGKYSDPVIGIYRRNTHDVLEIEDCPLHHPLINKVVKAAKAGIKKGKVPIYHPKSEMGLLRYLVVRVAEPSDKVMVVLVTSEQGYNEIHHLAKFIQQAVPEVAVVTQNINTSTGNVIFGHKDRFITKAQTLRAFVGEKSFNLSPNSFFQVNSGAARIIYEKVRELARLTGKERVIDVYCGIGGISLYLAEQAKEVVGIEFVEAAVADATQNAALNQADNCSFEAGDAAHLIDEIGEEGGADLIVLNPPRKGCEEKVLKSVAAIKPARIIYVSCSPETLARDLDILARLGYRTLEVNPVDMFPQTVHVEDVALLERTEA